MSVLETPEIQNRLRMARLHKQLNAECTLIILEHYEQLKHMHPERVSELMGRSNSHKTEVSKAFALAARMKQVNYRLEK